MAGVKKAARLPALALAASVAAMAACSSPSSFLGAVNDEAKVSLDRYLEVTGVSPERNAVGVNPSNEIKIDFDRALELSTVTADNITVAAAGSPGALGWSSTFDAAQKRLTLKPAGLEGGEEYVVTLGSGLLGSKGERLQSAQVWSFETANLPGGSVWINVTNPIKPVPQGEEIQAATYATSNVVTLYMRGNELVDVFIASEDPALLNGAMAKPTVSWIAEPFTLSEPDGEKTVYVRFKEQASGNLSDIISDTIILDRAPPLAPTTLAISSLTTHTPIWTWASGGSSDRSGIFRYRVYHNGGTAPEYAETSDLSFTTPGLADGTYNFEVGERDLAGLWSSTTTLVSAIDGPPNPPTITATSPTVEKKPTWSWTGDPTYGGGIGQFRFKLDPPEIYKLPDPVPNTSYTPVDDLEDGEHVLIVQERDAAGHWSTNASMTVLITPFIPYREQKNVLLSQVFSWRSQGVGLTYTVLLGARSGDLKPIGTTTSTSFSPPEKALERSTTYYWCISYQDGRRTVYYPDSNGVPFRTIGK